MVFPIPEEDIIAAQKALDTARAALDKALRVTQRALQGNWKIIEDDPERAVIASAIADVLALEDWTADLLKIVGNIRGAAVVPDPEPDPELE